MGLESRVQDPSSEEVLVDEGAKKTDLKVSTLPQLVTNEPEITELDFPKNVQKRLI